MFDSYLFWKEDYIQRENELLDFMKYIPLAKEHEGVWSIKLANQLLLIGSSIDSFFQCARDSFKELYVDNCLKNTGFHFIGSLNDYNINVNLLGYTPEDFIEESDFHERIMREGKTNMGLFRELFEDHYNLSEKTVYVLRNKEEIKPFKEWVDDKSPDWWKVYTNLKHNRFDNKESATLEMTLNALAALFLLNIYHIENREFLVNAKVIRGNCNLRNTEFIDEKDCIPTLEPIIAKTKLFGYVFETKGPWNQYPWRVLDPGNIWGI